MKDAFFENHLKSFINFMKQFESFDYDIYWIIQMHMAVSGCSN